MMTPSKVVRTVKANRVKKSAKKVVRARAVSAETVSEIFTTQPQQPEQIEVPVNSVVLFVNGRNKGTVHTEGQTLTEFAVFHAQQAGIKNFSLYVDDVKAYTDKANMKLSQVKKIELVTKDARGTYYFYTN